MPHDPNESSIKAKKSFVAHSPPKSSTSGAFPPTDASSRAAMRCIAHSRFCICGSFGVGMPWPSSGRTWKNSKLRRRMGTASARGSLSHVGAVSGVLPRPIASSH